MRQKEHIACRIACRCDVRYCGTSLIYCLKYRSVFQIVQVLHIFEEYFIYLGQFVPCNFTWFQVIYFL
mgnify:CR=1 FL=1